VPNCRIVIKFYRASKSQPLFKKRVASLGALRFKKGFTTALLCGDVSEDFTGQLF
jgi:hypothetical protein